MALYTDAETRAIVLALQTGNWDLLKPSLMVIHPEKRLQFLNQKLSNCDTLLLAAISNMRADFIQPLADMVDQKERLKLLTEKSSDGKRMPLTQAVYMFNVEMVKVLINCVSKNDMLNFLTKSPDKVASLTIAVAKPDISIVKALVDSVTDHDRLALVRYKGSMAYTPLQIAISKGDIDLIKAVMGKLCEDDCSTLLAEQDDNGCTPLMVAAFSGNEELVKYFLKMLPQAQQKYRLMESARGYTCLQLAAHQGYSGVVRAIFRVVHPSTRLGYLQQETSNGATAVLLAARSGHLSTMRYMIQSLTPKEQVSLLIGLNARGSNLLIEIMSCIELDTLHHLIASIEPTMRLDVVNAKTSEGLTALMIAASTFEAAQQVEVLLKPFDMEARTTLLMATDNIGQTPLIIALHDNLAANLQTMLQSINGVWLVKVLNAKIQGGMNALMCASIAGLSKCLNICLENIEPEMAGERIMTSNDEKVSTLMFAAMSGDRASIQAIMSRLSSSQRQDALRETDQRGMNALHMAACNYLTSEIDLNERGELPRKVIQDNQKAMNLILDFIPNDEKDEYRQIKTIGGLTADNFSNGRGDGKKIRSIIGWTR